VVVVVFLWDCYNTNDMVNGPPKKKVIMVIEDEPEIIGPYREYLEVEGFQVEMITTGSVAMSRIRRMLRGDEEIPQVIILDLLLLDISGLAILETIRKESAFDGTFVVIFTNYQSQNLKKTTEEIHRVKYLLKANTSPTDLVGIIKESI